MSLLLGIDLGTSYFKVGLFDRNLEIQGLGRVAVRTRVEGPRRELPTEDFWQCLRSALEQALEQAGADPGRIAALSYSSQANSFLLLDRGNRPLTPLVLWPDSRQPDPPPGPRALQERDDFGDITGMGGPLGPGSAVTKLFWWQRQQPERWREAARFLTISDYLSWSLTGRLAGDAGTGALLALLDQRSLDWWEPALAAAGLRRDQMARPLRPGTLVAPLSAEGASRLGLPPGCPLVAGTLDHHAAALGAGLGQAAEVSVSIGTVLACVAQARQYRPRPEVFHLPGVAPGTHALLAYDNNGAGVLEWYHATQAPELDFKHLDELAAAVPPDCDGLRALPQAHLRPGLTGFEGRRPGHGPGQYARAIMTSVADTLGMLLERLDVEQRPPRAVATGGGAHSSFWLELIRERLKLDIRAARCAEPACRGAAMLARRGLQECASHSVKRTRIQGR